MSINRHIKQWAERYFSDAESLGIIVILALALITLATLGGYLAPLIAAFVVAFLLDGLVATCVKWGMNKKVSTYLVYLVFIGLLFAAVFLLLPLIWSQVSDFIKNVPNLVSQLQAFLYSLPEKYPSIISTSQVDATSAMVTSNITDVTQNLLAISINGIQGAAHTMIYLVLVPILVFFIMSDDGSIARWFIRFLPRERPIMNKVWSEFITQCANYARGKVVEIFIVGTVSTIMFKLFGLPFSVLLGVLVGLSVIIPFLGAAVVTIPVAIIGFMHFGSGTELIWLIIAYGILQFLDGNVLVPLLFSEAVSIHPVAIIAAVLVFGGIWGIWGVFFAIPLATLLKALINAWVDRDECEGTPESVAP